VPLDVAVGEILPAAVDEDGVLPAEEAAVAEHDAVRVDAEGERLADGAGAVGDGQVLPDHAVAVDLHRRGAERADGLAVRPGHGGVQVVGDDGLRRVLARDEQVAALALHVDALEVGAGLDQDDPARIGGAGAHGRGADGLLHGGVVPGAVERDDGVGLRGRGDQGRGQAEQEEAEAPAVAAVSDRRAGQAAVTDRRYCWRRILSHGLPVRMVRGPGRVTPVRSV
jgi:hypothetical protein